MGPTRGQVCQFSNFPISSQVATVTGSASSQVATVTESTSSQVATVTESAGGLLLLLVVVLGGQSTLRASKTGRVCKRARAPDQLQRCLQSSRRAWDRPRARRVGLAVKLGVIYFV